MLSKPFIRNKIREKRKNFNKLEYFESNKIICTKINDLLDKITETNNNFSGRKSVIGLYLPMIGEPDLLSIIDKLNYQVCMPVAIKEIMYFVEYNIGDELENSEGLMTLKQPVSEVRLEPEIVVVPGIAYSLLGERVGFGVGHYDIFFDSTKERSEIIRIGTCFHENLYETLPSQSHDILMNYIVTESITVKL